MLTVGGRVLRVATRDGNPGRPYHLATLAPMLTGLLDVLGVARADVLGISWGGGLAQQFALTSLPRLRKLRPPTLSLAGDDDPIIPLVNARIMHRLIPHSQLHVYHGGHLELGTGAERRVVPDRAGGVAGAGPPARSASIWPYPAALGPSKGVA